MSQIEYSIGLACNGWGKQGKQVNKLVKIEITESDGLVCLQPVSGHNLSAMPGKRLITRAEYDALPIDPTDGVPRAMALMQLCGWVPMALDSEGV